MRIRRLELHGFKSFKDRTVIHFDEGITGIVGPNGCGKSNVVDAFFWVMGEQNARLLRGQNMNDLIFAGADKAPPASFAEVTLVLEMPGELSGPNAPAGASASLVSLPTREVAITRKLYRSGECDYFMNKVPCRLRDIQELFMDTGVGSRGYSIIQQGQIAKIVQAKPEDRRTMIEEVAGIVKYKARRKESARKLEGTQQNLLRATDVINELETQKRQMERQAEKARKHKEWKERLQGIELSFNALSWEDLSGRFEELERDIEEKAATELALTTAREAAETQISQSRLELTQASQVAEEFQQKWMSAAGELNNAENELRYTRKNIEDARSSLAEIEKESEAQRSFVEGLLKDQESLELEAATIDEQFAAAEATRLEKEEQSSESRRRSEETAAKAGESGRKLVANGTLLEKARSAASFARQRITELENDVARHGQELESRESTVSQAESEKVLLTERCEEAKREAEELRSQSRGLEERIAGRQRELNDGRKQLSNLESEQARLRTTLRTLEEQKARHENSSQGVRSLFQSILPARPDLESAVQGTLSDLLEVDSGMEVAVEAALGSRLDLVLTSDSSLHVALGTALKENGGGRASFGALSRPATGRSPFVAPAELEAAVLGPLSRFARPQASAPDQARAFLDDLLAPILLVRDPESAQRLSALAPELSFVTPDGGLFRGGWYMEGGDQSSVSGSFVSRNREITELTEKCAELATRAEALHSSLEELEGGLQALHDERRGFEEAHRTKQAEISTLSGEEATAKARLQEAQRSLEHFRRELERAQGELTRLTEAEKEAKVSIFSLETERGALELESEQLSARLQEERSAWETAQLELVDARVRAASLQEQKTSFDSRKRQNDSALSQHSGKIQSMLENARRRRDEIETGGTRVTELEGSIGTLRSSVVDAEDNYRRAKERFDELNFLVEEQRSAAQAHANQERELKDSLLELRLEHQRIAGDRELLARNTLEHYGLVLAEYALQPETMEQVLVIRNGGDQMLTEIRNEVLLLKERIRKLGDVNPGAVEEYDAIVERYNLLSQQRADLEKAMKDLQSTVDRINHVSKERFERAFGEVNKHFQKVFPVIFGGGHATLALTMPEDLLETGVDITAQPPGKKPQNINLLSGGEKTLTAISLLFAIFLVKPSPFCLLDEVDAPLDDANIGRFNALLREMSKRSQFVIITHNKRTMELNDKLYGVTMEDAGVSKMVSIQLTA